MERIFTSAFNLNPILETSVLHISTFCKLWTQTCTKQLKNRNIPILKMCWRSHFCVNYWPQYCMCVFMYKVKLTSVVEMTSFDLLYKICSFTHFSQIELLCNGDNGWENIRLVTPARQRTKQKEQCTEIYIPWVLYICWFFLTGRTTIFLSPIEYLSSK
jgi:hypothetical protein